MGYRNPCRECFLFYNSNGNEITIQLEYGNPVSLGQGGVLGIDDDTIPEAQGTHFRIQMRISIPYVMLTQNRDNHAAY